MGDGSGEEASNSENDFQHCKLLDSDKKTSCVVEASEMKPPNASEDCIQTSSQKILKIDLEDLSRTVTTLQTSQSASRSNVLHQS